MKKRDILLISLIFVIVFSLSVNAGIFTGVWGDWLYKMTGKAVDNETNTRFDLGVFDFDISTAVGTYNVGDLMNFIVRIKSQGNVMTPDDNIKVSLCFLNRYNKEQYGCSEMTFGQYSNYYLDREANFKEGSVEVIVYVKKTESDGSVLLSYSNPHLLDVKGLQVAQEWKSRYNLIENELAGVAANGVKGYDLKLVKVSPGGIMIEISGEPRSLSLGYFEEFDGTLIQPIQLNEVYGLDFKMALFDVLRRDNVCLDPDGKNLFTKGQSRGLDSYGKTIIYSYDFCTEISGGVETYSGAFVAEENCQKDGKLWATYEKCPSGYLCKDGACIKGKYNETPQKACTKEAKMCPDGSYVGRDPNLNCEFKPCPNQTKCGCYTECDESGCHEICIECPLEKEVDCSDGYDNDFDGMTDCQDSDCEYLCNEQNKEVCNDGFDNDFDEYTDCDDLDCIDSAYCFPGAINGECKDGCLTEKSRCVPYGTRVGKTYCSIYGGFDNQRAEGNSCDNNYECITNECGSGKCISTYGVLQKIWMWINRLFRFG